MRKKKLLVILALILILTGVGSYFLFAQFDEKRFVRAKFFQKIAEISQEIANNLDISEIEFSLSESWLRIGKLQLRDRQGRVLLKSKDILIQFNSFIFNPHPTKITIESPELFLHRDHKGLNLLQFDFEPAEEKKEKKGPPVVIPEIFLHNAAVSYQDSQLFQENRSIEIPVLDFSLQADSHFENYQMQFSAENELLRRVEAQGRFAPSQQEFHLEVAPLMLPLTKVLSLLRLPVEVKMQGQLATDAITVSHSKKTGQWQYQTQIRLDASEIAVAKFPKELALQKVHLQTDVASQRLYNLQADIACAAGDMEVEQGVVTPSSLYLPVKIPNFVVKPQLLPRLLEYVALPQKAKEILQQCQLEGKVSSAGVLEVAKKEQGQFDWSIAGESELQNFSLFWQDRPIGVSSFTTKLKWDKQHVVVKEGHWQIGEGKFEVVPGSTFYFHDYRAEDVEVHFHSLQITKKTWETFPELVFLWEFLWPQGTVSGKARLQGDVRKNLPTCVLYCKDFQAIFEEIPYPAENIQAELFFEKDCLYLKKITGKFKGNDAQVLVKGQVWPLDYPEYEPALDVEVTCIGVPVDHNIYEAFNVIQDPESWHVDVREVWNELRPEQGKLWVKAHVWRGFHTHKDPSADVEIRFADAAINYVEFPYPVTNGMGRVLITVRDEKSDVRIRDTSAQNNNSRIFLEGELAPRDPGMGVSLRVEGKNVGLDQDLKMAVGEKYHEIWEACSPSGTTHLEVKLAKTPEEETISWQAVAKLQGIQVTHEEFPYPISNLRGKIHLSPQKFRLVELLGEGVGKGAKARIDGWINEDTSLSLNISARNIALDKHLYQALPSEVQKVWDDFSLEGKINGDIQVARTSNAPFFWNAKVFFQQLRGKYMPFPYEFRKIQGSLFISPQRLQIEKIQARTATGGQVQLQGKYEEQKLSLNLTASDLVLNEALFQALPGNLKETLNNFVFEGRVDVQAQLQYANELLNRKIAIFPKNCALTYKEFPLRLGSIQGSTAEQAPVEITDHYVYFRKLQGRNFDSAITINGHISQLQEPKHVVRLDITGSQVAINQEFRQAAALYFPELIAALSPTGKMERVKLELFATENQDVSYLRYRILGKKVQMQMAKESLLRSLKGKIDLEGFSYGKRHSLQGKWHGEVGLPEATLTDVKTRISYLNDYLYLDDIRGDMYGGDLEGKVVFDTSSYGSFQGRFNLSRAIISRWAKEEAEKAKNLSGYLSGKLAFEGNRQDATQLSGQGQLIIREGNLWELPIFLMIFDLLSLPSKPAFREGEIIFKLSEEAVNISQIKFHSSLLSITGNGTVDWQGNLNLTLLSHFAPKLLPRIPIISKIWNEIKSYLLAFSVKGTLANPSVNLLNVRNIQKIMENEQKNQK